MVFFTSSELSTLLGKNCLVRENEMSNVDVDNKSPNKNNNKI